MDFLTALEQLDLESTQPQTDATDSAAVVVLAFRCKCIENSANQDELYGIKFQGCALKSGYYSISYKVVMMLYNSAVSHITAF